MHSSSRPVAVVLLLLSVFACSPKATAADAGSGALKSLGGAVYRGESGGFVVVLSWSPTSRLEFHMKNPALPHASMMCAESVGDELPSTVECDYGRGIALEQTKAGLKVTLNPALARETYYFTAEGDKGKPGPTVYTLTRADPIATSYDPKLFDAGARYIPNSSPETRHLPGKRTVKPAQPERIALAVRRAGFDPATLWLDLVDSLRSRVESLPDHSEWSVMSKEEREAFIDKMVADKVIAEAPRVRTSTDGGSQPSSK